ncbi:transporter substrate-binding domain-containing protein [Acidiphilium sp.]|uniref:transporter substrate-binding domain-containing protein n=1 Tax=Acidiphilium sp. TaxID=527 RepID=UPI003CFC5FC6
MPIDPKPTLIERRRALQLLAFLPAASLAGLPVGARAATLAEIRKRGVINVASEDDFQPFEFVENGKPTGYDIELFATLSKTMGFKVHHDMIPWTGILPGVVTGKYDVAVTAVLITPQRLKTLDFTSPVAESVDYYMKRADDRRITDIKDLSGLTLGVEAGSAMLSLLPQLNDMLKKTGGKLGKVVQYQDYPSAYQDLASGRLDYVVNTYLNLRDAVAKRPGVFALGQPVSKPIYIAWAMKKGNSALLSLFDEKIAAARKDGTMAKLQEKWFGTVFKNLPSKPVA